MKELGFDFGLLIAYLIPGAVAVLAIDSFAPGLLQAIDSKEVDKTILFVAFAIISGMVVSLVRGSSIDRTFGIDLHRIPLLRSQLHYGPSERVEIDYLVLTHEGTLNAYRDAVIQLKRPYQFYGNTLVATVFWATTVQPNGWRVWLILSGAWFLLYVGARISNFRFMTAVQCLNRSHTHGGDRVVSDE